MPNYSYAMSKAEEALDSLINHKGCGCEVHLLPQAMIFEYSRLWFVHFNLLG
mgnify:CR=1 FL=1